MKRLQTLTTFFIATLFSIGIYGQGSVGINNTGSNPDASAMLDVSATDKGVLIPRMSTSQKNAILSPATGLVVYDIDTKSIWYYNGNEWIDIEDGDGSSSNELQTLSKTGNTITLSNGGGSITDDTGPFEEVNNTVRLVDNTDDLLIGRDDMPVNGQNISDNFLMFDNSKSAFRGGRLVVSNNWSPDSIGQYSFGYGYNIKALGFNSTAFGLNTSALGWYSFASGNESISPSGYETAFGRYNTNYTPFNATGWNINDRLFVVGNGTSEANRNDAFSIMKNGNATLQGTLTLTNGTDSYTLPNTDGAANQILKTDGSGSLTWSSDDDISPNNEIQTLSKSGNTITLSNGGGSISDAVNDADSDPTNEIQTLSLTGTNMTISGGNTLDVTSLKNLWSSGGGPHIYHFNNVGIGTNSTPTSKLLISQTLGEDGITVNHNHSGSSPKEGIEVNVSSAGSGIKRGIFSQVVAGSSINSTGLYTYVVAGASGTHAGINASISGAGTAVVGTAIDASGVAAKMTGPSHLIGNVAIGTEEELGILHVHDPNNNEAKMYVTPNLSSSEGSSSIFLAEDDDATFGMEWNYNGVSNRLELLGKSGTTIYGPHLYINRNDGNMALGSASFASGFKLSVDGKVACEEVLVELSTSWPDYVFQEDYKLKPLEELSEFIKKEKHLPGISPASEMESNGIKLGEMQRLLTEKVEELTLYIIQLNEDNKALRNRISNLESDKK